MSVLKNIELNHNNVSTNYDIGAEVQNVNVYYDNNGNIINNISNNTEILPTTLNNISINIDQIDGNGTAKIAINPSASEIANFKNGAIWIEVPPPPYLTFSSDSAFTLSVNTPGWDGTLEYSTNGSTWSTWDGSQLSGTSSQPIYIRGTNNTKITDNGNTWKWTFTGKSITGNIENLLDYQTVSNGQHPIMANYCYAFIFEDCASLINPPKLPATTLSNNCYSGMFYNCSSLQYAPDLSALTLANFCYYDMFYGCSSLLNTPRISATTLAENCCIEMFRNCTSLISIPKLQAATLISNCYYDMFKGCTSIKLSTTQTGEYQYSYRIPIEGAGTTASNALDGMFYNTGGAFTGTPTINTTYYTNHAPV